jgi:hypothetical protein
VASTALDATTSSTTGLAPSETSTTAANPDAAVAASARSRSSEGESGGGRTAGTALGMIAVMALAGGGAFAAHRRKRA